MTKNVGVLGYPLHHTVSPAFQQPAFDALALDTRYHVWALPPEELGEFVHELRRPDYLGANVTIPYKEIVPGYMDELVQDAQRLGAVNTIQNLNGRLVGYNTDVPGFTRALKNEGGFDPHGSRVLLLGAGGAALACVAALVNEQAASIQVMNRTPGRAAALVKRFAAWAGETRLAVLPPDQDALYRAVAGSDLIVNTTPVGMLRGSAPDALPFAPEIAEALGPHTLVYDLVYNPPLTPLLKIAEAHGARTLGGLPMLVYQGAVSFEIWTGQPAPVALMMERAYACFAG